MTAAGRTAVATTIAAVLALCLAWATPAQAADTLAASKAAGWIAQQTVDDPGKAADALNLTQPALTRTLKRLEHQLGVSLFERHAHGGL